MLHTHSLPAALLSYPARDEGQILLSGWELLKGLSGIDTHEVGVSLPVFPNSQEMQALSALVERSLSSERSCYGFVLVRQGLFWFHKEEPDDEVFALLCGQGDLISVPANIRLSSSRSLRVNRRYCPMCNSFAPGIPRIQVLH